MTDKEIIRKVVDKAVKNGYSEWNNFVPLFPPTIAKVKEKVEALFNSLLLTHKEGIIFSHSFAKCFWGEKPVCIECGCEMDNDGERNRTFQCSEYCENVENGEPNWRFHLKEIVLENEEDRLKYLEKYL